MDFDLSVKGNCILSAEDNDVNQMVLQHTLSEQSVPFVIVENGKLAVEAWRALAPKLILMDISMPVMNGLEAMDTIRKEEEALGSRVPIIALTAHALKGDEEKMLLGGADYYLTKPINPTTLLQKIDAILSPSTQVFAQ